MVFVVMTLFRNEVRVRTDYKDEHISCLQARIDKCREGPRGELWKDTQALASHRDLLTDLSVRPDAVFVGVPPVFHGKRRLLMKCLFTQIPNLCPVFT